MIEKHKIASYPAYLKGRTFFEPEGPHKSINITVVTFDKIFFILRFGLARGEKLGYIYTTRTETGEHYWSNSIELPDGLRCF